MKYLVTILLILGFIGPAFGQSMGDISDKIWLPNCPIGTSVECDQAPLFPDAIALPFFQSDSVAIGTIVEKDSKNQDSIRYSIDVDFYLKNYQPFDLIAATLNDAPEPQTLPEVFWYNSPVFNEGDLVFVYLKKVEGGYRLLPESFALDKHEVRGPPPTIHWNNSPSEDIFDQGEKILVSGEVRKMDLVKAAKEGKQLDVKLMLLESHDRNSMVFSDIMEIGFDGNYNYSLDTSKIPPGNYELEVNYGPSTFGNGITITPNFKIWTPLKQISMGISMEKIQCRENLVLVQKYDGSPACVSIFTKIELIIRGWGEDDRLLLGCTPSRYETCYPSNQQEYRKALYDYHFDNVDLPASGSFDFTSLHTINACSESQVCFGKFENGTKIRISCDYPLHGCGVLSFDDYKTTENVEWKKYITISASRIDKGALPENSTVHPVNELSNPILSQLEIGADGCKNETEMCALSRGVSLDRTNSLGIRIDDHEDYTISLNRDQAELLFSQLKWTIKDDGIYLVMKSQERYYFVVLETFDEVKTPDVKMKLIDTLSHPVNMVPGDILNYTIQLDAWSTYGTPAAIDLVARQDAKDSGLNVWIEPEKLTVPERGNATSILFIEATENAQHGIYDVRVIGKVNGKNANLYCSNTVCPTINIGNSDWKISTFGSNSGRAIGAPSNLDSTWLELELQKNEFFEGEIVEIKTYLINNSTSKIEFSPRELLITVIKAEPVGYFENLYGIDARFESDNTITLEPKSKTLLVRPFYWNQITFENFDEEQRLDPKRYKMVAKFVGENFDWSDDMWFEIK